METILTKKSIIYFCLFVLFFTGSFWKVNSQNLSSVIDEAINFLRLAPVPNGYAKSVSFEFTLFDNTNVKSGQGSLKVDSSTTTIGTNSVKKYFLKSTNSWVNPGSSPTNKTFTFTTPMLSTAPSTLTISSSAGTTSNNIPYNTPAFKTNNSTSTTSEYIISGFHDPANPKKYISIRIIAQQFFISG